MTSGHCGVALGRPFVAVEGVLATGGQRVKWRRADRRARRQAAQQRAPPRDRTDLLSPGGCHVQLVGFGVGMFWFVHVHVCLFGRRRNERPSPPGKCPVQHLQA